MTLTPGTVRAPGKRATGRRTPWRVLKPEDMTGVYGVFNCFLTPDGEGHVYTYGQAFTDLFLLEGLRF